MRILATNLTDISEITAAPAMVATLPETNLQNAYREQVARWTTIDAQSITLTWSGAKAVSCVCLYRNNFSSSATWRVRVYEDATLATVVYNSGYVDACAPVPLGNLVWGVDPLGKSLYSDWDYGVATLWFTAVLGGGVVIDIIDSENADGYCEASRLFVGSYFEPTCGVALGMNLAWKENTQQSRTEGGSLRTEAGASWRELTVDLRTMPEADRRQAVELLRKVGLRNDLFVSVYPGLADERERDYQMQAKLIALPAHSTPHAFYTDQQFVFGEI